MPRTINLENYSNIPNDLKQIEQLSKKYKIDFVERKIRLGEIEFALIDVKLSPWPDEDVVYKNDNIRLLIPRGLCFIFANNKWVHTLYGHPKFGNFGDYVQQNMSIDFVQQNKKIFTSKENGECAHWGAFELNNIIYEIYGSKNVHMIVRSHVWSDDLKLYTEIRYSYALKMANLINTYDKTLALNFLTTTKYTLCGEGCFVDSQHFVNYTNSTMFFFAATTKRENLNDPILKMSPLEFVEYCKSIKLTPVNEIILCENIGQQIDIEKYFEYKNNSEGAVVSCLNEHNQIVYMYKHKNIKYIYERALREQMKKNANSLKIKERFRTIHIFHPDHEKLLEKFLNFNSWYKHMNLSQNEKDLFFSNWVRMMEKFDSFTPDEQMVYGQLDQINQINQIDQTDQLVVIMTIGFPGSGKSFLARCSEHIINSNAKLCIHLEQDMFKSNKLYQEAISKTIKNNKLNYLILAKSNHNKNTRQSTYDTLFKSTREIKIIYVMMTIDDDDDLTSTFELCVERIKLRGLSHATLFAKSEEEIKNILTNIFVKNYQGLTKEELVNNCIKLNINQPKLNLIKSFCEKISQYNILQNDFAVTDKQLFEIFNKIDGQDQNIQMLNKIN